MDLPDVKSVATTAELFTRAAAGSILPDALWGGGDSLPAQSETRTAVRINPGQLNRYRHVCEFADDGSLPVTFPSILGFASGLRLMTGRHFPLRALGMIHLTDQITAKRTFAVDEALTIKVHAQHLRSHRLGALVDLVTAVSGAQERRGEVAWREVSTYLSRGARVAGATGDESANGSGAEPFEVPEVSADADTEDVALPGNLGRAFAGVSGDRNPIHMNPLLARAFGFRTTIVHGRWLMARSVAQVAESLAPAVTVTSSFRKPLFIPGHARIASQVGDAGAQVWLTGVDGTPLHAYTAISNNP